MLHAQHGLDQAGNSGRFQGVADVGFDAGDRGFVCPGHFGAKHFAQRFQLGGVAQLGGGGMAFEILQAGHVDARAIGPLHGLDLAFFARRPQAFAAAVGRHAQPAHHRLNRIAVGQGPLQRFHHHGHIAFGHDQPVGVGIERPRSEVALIAWATENKTSVWAVQSEAPPAMAMSTRPCCSARAPISMACSDEAQAEFRASQGPVRPKALATVPATMLQYKSRPSAGISPTSANILAWHCCDESLPLLGSERLQLLDAVEQCQRLVQERGVSQIAQDGCCRPRDR